MLQNARSTLCRLPRPSLWRLLTVPRITALALMSLLVGTTWADISAAPTRQPQVEVRAIDARARESAREIERLAERLTREFGVVGLGISIVHGDEVLLERGFGLQQMGRNDPVGADTAFRLASLSKPIAGALAGLLVLEGALSWDTRVADHLPAFSLANADTAMNTTAADLLSHRVGLGFHTFDRELEADQPYPVLAQRLAEAPMLCPDGRCYAYQNIAFSLIGDLAFAVTGDFFTLLVEKKLFHPLGMFGATYGREGLESSSSWARPHVMRGGRFVALRPKENYYRVPPAAGVNASARDMSQWLLAQMGRRPDVLPPELLEATQAPRIATASEMRAVPWRQARLRSAHYGLGWRIFDYSGEKLVFHGGAVQGYRAVIAFLPERGFGIAILANCECRLPSQLMPIAIDRVLDLPRRDWLELDKQPRRRR
ncbi:MAG: beta-lactamase family protein [Aquimonas sp.]|nr:beta-lactamase family protein [Aquimonas sp.]